MPTATMARGRGHDAVHWKARVEDLTEEAVEYLASVVRERPTGRGAAVAVAAAGHLVKYSAWLHDRERQADPAAVLVQVLGDSEAALSWIRSVLPQLEAQQRSERVGLARLFGIGAPKLAESLESPRVLDPLGEST